MIPELAASTINSQLPVPAPAAPTDRRMQAAFQRQLAQAREDRQPDSAGKPDGAASDAGETANTQAGDADRQTERLRGQAASQRKTRPTAPAAPAASDKPATGQAAAAPATAPEEPAGSAAGSDPSTAQAEQCDPSASAAATAATPVCDPVLVSLLAASQSKAAAAATDPATAAVIAGGLADAAAAATAAPPARGTRHAGAGHELPGAAATRAAPDAPGAAVDLSAQAGALQGAAEGPAGSAFESNLAQARQSLPAEMLRGMTSPTGNDLAALQGRLDVAGAPSATPSTTIATVEAPVTSPAFAPEFTERISTMIDGGIERAEILVTPKDMGPVRIELTLSGDDARLVFTATQPDTRQAIEQSSALLRSMLAERGLTLAGMDINQGNAGNPQQSQQPDNGPRNGHSPSIAVQIPPVRSGGTAGPRRGLLDLFA